MHSASRRLALRTSIERPKYSGPSGYGTREAFCFVMSAMKWLGMTPFRRSNHHAERRDSTSPLRGTPPRSTTSNDEMRSVATISSWSPRSYVSRTLPRAKRFGRSVSRRSSGIFTTLEFGVEDGCRGRHQGYEWDEDDARDADADRTDGQRPLPAGIGGCKRNGNNHGGNEGAEYRYEAGWDQCDEQPEDVQHVALSQPPCTTARLQCARAIEDERVQCKAQPQHHEQDEERPDNGYGQQGRKRPKGKRKRAECEQPAHARKGWVECLGERNLAALQHAFHGDDGGGEPHQREQCKNP